MLKERIYLADAEHFQSQVGHALVPCLPALRVRKQTKVQNFSCPACLQRTHVFNSEVAVPTSS